MNDGSVVVATVIESRYVGSLCMLCDGVYYDDL